MADRILHFAAGMVLGTALTLVPVARAWMKARRLAGPLARMLLWSYLLGIWAVMPNLLGRVGCPEAFLAGWWMNVFVLHPLVDAAHPGGMLVGEAAVLACFAFQYCLLVGALAYRARHPSGATQ